MAQDTLINFENWWRDDKKTWLRTPQEQKMAAKAAWDGAIKFMEENSDSALTPPNTQSEKL